MVQKLSKKNNEVHTFVVKSNALIEARYRLSLQEAQVILWLITQIKPDDEDFKSHKLDISEFAKLIGVDVDSKYRELRKITRQLMQRVMDIQQPNGFDYVQVAWLSSAYYASKQGCVLLEFSPYMKPYLLQLKSHFTKINVADTLKLKSIYAARIFELLVQYESIGTRKISLIELRSYCGIQEKEYKNYFDLKRYVVEKAKSEINSKTEYEIDYTEIKESRKIVEIEWTIKKKNSAVESRQKQIKNLSKELRSEQALVESMIEYGYSKPMARRFIKEHSEDVVKQALQAVDIQVERGQAKNPKAMIRTAIIERWKPDIYKEKKSMKK